MQTIELSPKKSVFCKNCTYFRGDGGILADPTYGDESCLHPSNFFEKPNYMGMKKYAKWLPVQKNKNADCELYEAKKPSFFSRFFMDDES